MFQPNSHKIVDISYCPLHRPSINRLIRDLKPALDASSLKPYDEATHTGDLRYLAIRASHLTDQVMVTFVCMTDEKKHELKAMILKLRNLGHTISSAHLNVNGDKTNTIFGSLSKRLAGADRLREQLCDLSFEIGPTSFFQVNPWQAEAIYRRVEQIAGPDTGHSVAWDLYCGTGQISMLLSQSASGRLESKRTLKPRGMHRKTWSATNWKTHHSISLVGLKKYRKAFHHGLLSRV